MKRYVHATTMYYCPSCTWCIYIFIYDCHICVTSLVSKISIQAYWCKDKHTYIRIKHSLFVNKHKLWLPCTYHISRVILIDRIRGAQLIPCNLINFINHHVNEYFIAITISNQILCKSQKSWRRLHWNIMYTIAYFN